MKTARDLRNSTVDASAIDRLVTTFYQRVRADAVLAPFFAAAVQEEQWPQHLERMKDFWSTVLLGSGRYQGRPVPLHAALTGLTSEHFERWLTLFAEVAKDVFQPELADGIAQLARKIGQGLARASIARNPERATATSPGTTASVLEG